MFMSDLGLAEKCKAVINITDLAVAALRTDCSNETAGNACPPDTTSTSSTTPPAAGSLADKQKNSQYTTPGQLVSL
ncbi:unnamed protein product, partial [Amoebophrya sp. A25]|eukprot:GSA25T00015720001.1